MNRRHFLSTSFAALGASALPAIEPIKRPGRPRLPLGCAAYGFREYFTAMKDKEVKPKEGHEPMDMLKFIAEKGCRLVITTDHGTVRVTEPSKVVGDRNTNTNLRYKHGKNLTYEAKDVFAVKDPSKALLPRANVSTVTRWRTSAGMLSSSARCSTVSHANAPHPALRLKTSARWRCACLQTQWG